MVSPKKSSTSIAARTIAPLVLAASSVVLAGCTEEPVVQPEVFDSTMLHQVQITVDATYLGQLAVDLDNRVPCSIVYDGEEIPQAGIRQKGNMAIPLDQKPSFSLRFDEFDSKADLHGLHKLILNNSIQDPTFLREKLGADAHARAGLFAARIAHAKVTFNGVDKGIFVVAESVDKDFLQLRFGKDYDEGNLYEGPCCGDFAVDTKYRESDMTLDDEKKDNRSRNDINALANIITTAPDATFATDVATRLDLDEYLKTYALEVLLLHRDGFAFNKNNYYMYDNPADARFVFVPHGMDRILDDLQFDPSVQALETRLPQRVRSIPAVDARFQELLVQLGTSAWNKSAMLSTIDSTVAKLHKAGAGAQTAADLAQLDANADGLRNIINLLDANMKP